MLLKIELRLGLIAALFSTLLIPIAPGTMPMILGCTLLASHIPYRQAATLGEA